MFDFLLYDFTEGRFEKQGNQLRENSSWEKSLAQILDFTLTKWQGLTFVIPNSYLIHIDTLV